MSAQHPGGGDPFMDDESGAADTDTRPTEPEVAVRAELLPEERAVGSDDPLMQAEAILEESLERTEHPVTGIHRTSQDATGSDAES